MHLFESSRLKTELNGDLQTADVSSALWLQLDTEAADILNDLQMRLSGVLDSFSTIFAKR